MPIPTIRSYIDYLKNYQELKGEEVNRELRELQRLIYEHLAFRQHQIDIVELDLSLRQQKKILARRVFTRRLETILGREKTSPTE